MIRHLTVISLCTIDPTNYKRPVYSKMWVDRLYRAIKRNLTLSFDFICLSNDLDQSMCPYELRPLETKSWGWWYKMEMFRPGAFSGPCLYIDLDTVICKNLTGYLENLPDNILLCPQEPYKDILNSSVIYWNGDFQDLYKEYKKNQSKIVEHYAYATEQQPNIADQSFMKDQLGDSMQAFDNHVPPGFFGWRHHKIQTEILDPHILIFTSTQKPSNNLDLDLVQKHWIN